MNYLNNGSMCPNFESVNGALKTMLVYFSAPYKVHVIAYLGLPEVTIGVTDLGTDVYCLAEMGKLFGYSGSFTVEDFSRITAS